nr:monofunctional riboflavin biosynthesis protein RIBA 3, chloroplastic [Ipomoea batatas]
MNKVAIFMDCVIGFKHPLLPRSIFFTSRSCLQSLVTFQNAQNKNCRASRSACWAAAGNSFDDQMPLESSENGSLPLFETLSPEITPETTDFFVSDAEGDPDCPSEGFSSVGEALTSLRQGKEMRNRGQERRVVLLQIGPKTVLALSSISRATISESQPCVSPQVIERRGSKKDQVQNEREKKLVERTAYCRFCLTNGVVSGSLLSFKKLRHVQEHISDSFTGETLEMVRMVLNLELAMQLIVLGSRRECLSFCERHEVEALGLGTNSRPTNLQDLGHDHSRGQFKSLALLQMPGIWKSAPQCLTEAGCANLGSGEPASRYGLEKRPAPRQQIQLTNTIPSNRPPFMLESSGDDNGSNNTRPGESRVTSNGWWHRQALSFLQEQCSQAAPVASHTALSSSSALDFKTLQPLKFKTCVHEASLNSSETCAQITINNQSKFCGFITAPDEIN